MGKARMVAEMVWIVLKMPYIVFKGAMPAIIFLIMMHISDQCVHSLFQVLIICGVVVGVIIQLKNELTFHGGGAR